MISVCFTGCCLPQCHFVPYCHFYNWYTFLPTCMSVFRDTLFWASCSLIVIVFFSSSTQITL